MTAAATTASVATPPLDMHARRAAEARHWRWSALVASLGAAGLYAAACPPYEHAWAAWAVPGVLLVPTRRLRPLRALLYGALFSVVLGYLCAPWVAHASLAYFAFNRVLAEIFAFLVYGVYIAIPCALMVAAYAATATLVRPAARAPLAAWLWASSDLLRAHLFTGLPYELLGHSQFRQLTLIQIADLGGVYAVSFVIALVSVAVAELLVDGWTQRPAGTTIVRRLGLPVAALCTVLLYGAQSRGMYGNPTDGTKRTIAIVQGNVANAFRWKREYFERTIATYAGLTSAVRQQQPDLIVWPENAVNFYIDREPGLRATLSPVAAMARQGLLVGAPRLSADGRAHNSAYLIGPSGRIGGTYDKRRLVPFAEYNPFPWLTSTASAEPVVYTAGASAQPLQTAGFSLGTVICYEVLFPHLVRDLVRNGAEMLINISNDSWLDRGDGVAPQQHFSMSIFRAVETRRSLVRASSSGVSGFVSPVGEVYSLLASETAGSAVASVVARHGETPYVRWGDRWIFIMSIGGGLGIAGRWGRRRFACIAA